MISLFVPVVLLILIIAIAVVLFKKKLKLSLVLLFVIFVINWWFECVPFRIWRTCNVDEAKTIKVISFNIDGSSGDALVKARKVRDFLKKYSPDVVFVAEFNEQFPRALDSLLSAEYTYTTYPDSLFFQYFYGNTPFFNSRRLKDRDGDWIGVYACSTVFQGDTIDLYGCHLASNNYAQNQERTSPGEIGNAEGIIKYIKNTQMASLQRKIEVEALVGEMKKSNHSVIVMGDMNDVSGSPALRVLEKAGLKDTWWEAGVGYGATISRPLPYRIDHIMHNDQIITKCIELLDSHDSSDHHALYAEFLIDK